MRCVPLFSRCLAIRLQDRVDERYSWRKLRMLALGYLPGRRYRARQRFTNFPPMNPKLPRNLTDRPGTVLVLTSDLLVQLHLGSPVLQSVYPSGLRRPNQDIRLVGYRWGQIRRAKGANSE